MSNDVEWYIKRYIERCIERYIERYMKRYIEPYISWYFEQCVERTLVFTEQNSTIPKSRNVVKTLPKRCLTVVGCRDVIAASLNRLRNVIKMLPNTSKTQSPTESKALRRR